MRAARLREASVPAPQQPQYQRRRPDQTPLYRLVREHYESFAAEVEAQGTSLPPFVKDEFDAYLGLAYQREKAEYDEKMAARSAKEKGAIADRHNLLKLIKFEAVATSR